MSGGVSGRSLSRKALSARLARWRDRTLDENVAALARVLRLYLPLATPSRRRLKGHDVAIHHRATVPDKFAIYQCFTEKQYRVPPPPFGEPVHEQRIDARHAAIVAAGAVPLIVDCGAHIGAAALWFTARYPGARVVAIEPAEENLAVLRRNAAGQPIAVVAAGIGPRDGRRGLTAGQGSMDFRTFDDPSAPRQVEIMSIGTVLARHGGDAVPFILKVDVEGGEKALFDADAWPVFDRFPVIMLEAHDFMMPGAGTTSGFLRFHAERERDFLFGKENIFSIDMRSLVASAA